MGDKMEQQGGQFSPMIEKNLELVHCKPVKKPISF